MVVPTSRWAWVLLLVLGVGCQGTAPAPAGTGAREVVRGYYEGLVQQDWAQAYDALHPDSKKRMTMAEFTRLAQSFRRNLGFEPEKVTVQSCDEQGTETLAHVILAGPASQHRRYKDGIVLRQNAGSWWVILPDNFGRKTR
jgi:hypothetical protein